MEDQFLIELLNSKYSEARDRFRDGSHSHEDLTIMMLKHQTNHIAHLESDLNAKIDDVKEEIKEIRGEIKDFKEEIRGEIKDVRGEIHAQTWKLLGGVAVLLGLFTFISRFL